MEQRQESVHEEGVDVRGGGGTLLQDSAQLTLHHGWGSPQQCQVPPVLGQEHPLTHSLQASREEKVSSLTCTEL